MKLSSLLGKRLKDDDVIDFLDDMEMPVIYDFDRLHEGQPDIYWASSEQAGIQLRFDEAQRLDTIFLYIDPEDGFASWSDTDSGIPIFTTAAAAEEFGQSQRLQISKGSADFLGVKSDWIRLGFGTYSIHYEFRASGLARITMSQSAVH